MRRVAVIVGMVVLAVGTAACSGTDSSAPTTTWEGAPILFHLQPPPPTSLDWSGFVITPKSCHLVALDEMQVAGSVTVPTLDGRGVGGEIQAWAESTAGGSSNGRFAAGQPWQIPDRSGMFSWTIKVHVPFETVDTPGCIVQGIDPDYSYAEPQQ